MPNAVLATDPLERLAKPEFDFDKAGPNKPLSDLASADVVQKLQNKGALAKQRLANIGSIGAQYAAQALPVNAETGMADPTALDRLFRSKLFSLDAPATYALGQTGVFPDIQPTAAKTASPDNSVFRGMPISVASSAAGAVNPKNTTAAGSSITDTEQVPTGAGTWKKRTTKADQEETQVVPGGSNFITPEEFAKGKTKRDEWYASGGEAQIGTIVRSSPDKGGGLYKYMGDDTWALVHLPGQDQTAGGPVTPPPRYPAPGSEIPSR